jgi:hypothetical protein
MVVCGVFFVPQLSLVKKRVAKKPKYAEEKKSFCTELYFWVLCHVLLRFDSIAKLWM